ncbi:MAG: hypothetical protein IPK74_14810 [Deltaproteobacteria bacterium]|nr:hypothetical protein [Deltaproteobacteria bacterium]
MDPTTRIDRTRIVLATLAHSASAAVLQELIDLGLGDAAARTELEAEGGDGIGTDAYELVRDAAPSIIALLDHDALEVRIHASYLLAMLVETAASSLPSLQARVDATEGIEQLAMRLAAARLRASIEPPTRPPMQGLPLDPDARGAAPLTRAAIAIAQVWRLPDFPRMVTAELAGALDDVPRGTAVGPWGTGDLQRLTAALRRTVVVRNAEVTAPASADPPVATDIGDAPVADPYTQQRRHRAPPQVVLPGLHEVAWGELEHAYGSADGVPGMIEALASEDAADRAWGLEALDASIHHQGSVYSASTAAVPFLLALVADARVGDRHRILELLCGLAVHDPAGCVVHGARRWRSEAFDAVLAGGPSFVACLRDGDPRVRSAAAFVLSFIEPSPADALAAVRRALEVEPDRRARASLLLALGYLSRYAETDAYVDVLRPWLDAPAPLLRTCAAIALVLQAGPAAPPQAGEVLLRARDEARAVHGFWPWHHGDAVGFAERIRMANKTLDEVLAELRDARARDDAEAVAQHSGRAFFMALRDGVHDIDHLWQPHELGDRQREILACIVDTAPPQGLLPLWEALLDAGLPSRADGLARLLGRARGPLDATVTIGEDTRPCWWALHEAQLGRLELDVVLAAMQRFDADERVALLDDFLSGPYQLARRRRPYDYDRDDSDYYHYTSAAIALAVRLVGDTAPALQWAQAELRTQLAKGRRRDAIRSLVAAHLLLRDAHARGVEPDAGVDALLALDQPPASTYVRALAGALALLPEPRCTALLAELPLFGYTAYVDSRGEVRRWTNQRGWAFLELMPVRIRVQRLVDAWVEWERHLGAGDDRQAEPVLGRVTATNEQRPAPDEPFPHEAAIAAMIASGPLAIERARADLRIRDRGWLDAAARAGE